MKKLQNLSNTTTMVKDSKLEAFIESEDLNIRQKTLEKASRDAENGLPKEGQNLDAYRYTIASDYQNLFQHARKELQVKEQGALNAHDSSYVKEKQEENNKAIADKMHERQSHKIECDRITDTFDRSKIFWVYLILGIVWLFNGIVDAKALSYGLTESFVISLFWGLLISGAIAGLAKVMPWVLDEWVPKKWQKIAVASASILLVGVITFIIGGFRSKGIPVELMTNAGTEAQHGGGSALIFSFINTFLYTVELLVCMFFLPSKEQEMRYAAKKKHLEKVAQLDKEIEALKKENADLTDELSSLVKIRMQNTFYEDYIKEWLEGKYFSAWGLYISENTMRRRDNFSPTESTVPALFPNLKTK
jgi:hypothetical protein